MFQKDSEQTEKSFYQRAELRTLWLKYDFSPPERLHVSQNVVK